MKGIFEDFIGIWDNNVDEKICKELIRYHDWSVKNKYNTSPDTGELIKDNNKDHEAFFMCSSCDILFFYFRHNFFAYFKYVCFISALLFNTISYFFSFY